MRNLTINNGSSNYSEKMGERAERLRDSENVKNEDGSGSGSGSVEYRTPKPYKTLNELFNYYFIFLTGIV